LSLTIASAIASHVAIKASNIINKYGTDIGVAAYKGGKFIAMTWAATVLVLVASVAWVVGFIVDQKRTRASGFLLEEMRSVDQTT
jgi:hypothetical protein